MNISFRAPVGGGPDEPFVIESEIDGHKFLFEPVPNPDGTFGVCVVKMPKCKVRRFDNVVKNTLFRGNHEYIWIEEGRIRSLNDAVKLANEFAQHIVEYIQTGKRFTLPREKD